MRESMKEGLVKVPKEVIENYVRVNYYLKMAFEYNRKQGVKIE